jgi:hypothetical protein
MDRMTNTAFDVASLVLWHQYWFEAIHVGVVVEAPNYEQLNLLGRIVSQVSKLEWSGKSEDVLGVFEQLSRFLEVDALARKGVELGEGSISVGGVARCESERLVAFRLGRFRVLSDGVEALPEQTMLREDVRAGRDIPGFMLPMLQPASAGMPSHRLGAGDLIVVDREGPPVRVVHSKAMLPGDVGEPRIDISATWVGP